MGGIGCKNPENYQNVIIHIFEIQKLCLVFFKLTLVEVGTLNYMKI